MACLIFSDDTGRQVVHALEQDVARLGRASDNDIVSYDLRVSRHHALVVREGETYRIRDAGSSLGVYVNNRRVEDSELRDGDLIRLGDSLYTFVNAPPPTMDTMVTTHPGAAALLGTTLLADACEAAKDLRALAAEARAGSGAPKGAVARTEGVLTRLESALADLRQGVARIERSRRMMQTLYEIGRVLNSSVDRGNLIDLIMDLALKVLVAERGFLMLRDSEGSGLKLRAHRNMGDEVSDAGTPTISTGIARQVAASGTPVLTSDALSDERFRDHKSVVNFRIRSVVCVPLVEREGRVLGVIYVDSRSAGAGFNEEDRDFLMAFANYAAIAIENARLVSETAARARMEEELRAVRRLDEMKSELMSIVAHDVRTPLTSIRSYAEILSDDFEEISPEDRRTFLERIVRQADRLDRLTSNYLDLAKIEAGKMDLRLEDLDAEDLVRETCDAFAGQAGEQKVALSAEAGDGAGRIRGDRDRLLQVLANLVSNALKFTREGGAVKVSAAPSALPQDRPAVLFEIKDTGDGIDPSDLEKLFRKFSQIGGGPAGRPRGTGLGLVVAREIVEMHGGRIGVESKPGEGSRFFFSVPVSGPEPGRDGR